MHVDPSSEMDKRDWLNKNRQQSSNTKRGKGDWFNNERDKRDWLNNKLEQMLVVTNLNREKGIEVLAKEN